MSPNTAATAARRNPPSPSAPKEYPLLESGDRLGVEDFHRRYCAMPSILRAELVEGVVYVSSPIRRDVHGLPHTHMALILGNYYLKTPGTECLQASTAWLQGDNEVQPDITLRIMPVCGGRTSDLDGYILGGPELAAEIAASSVSYDLHQKKDVYAANGVAEYLVWRVYDGVLDRFVLKDGAYSSVPPDTDGIVRSVVFPGLWIDPIALVADDMVRVLDVLNQGLASPEHAEFVQMLQSKAQSAETPDGDGLAKEAE